MKSFSPLLLLLLSLSSLPLIALAQDGTSHVVPAEQGFASGTSSSSGGQPVDGDAGCSEKSEKPEPEPQYPPENNDPTCQDLNQNLPALTDYTMGAPVLPDMFCAKERFGLRCPKKNLCAKLKTIKKSEIKLFGKILRKARNVYKLVAEACSGNMNFRYRSPLTFFWVNADQNGNKHLCTDWCEGQQQAGSGSELCAVHELTGTYFHPRGQKTTFYGIGKTSVKGTYKIRDVGRNAKCLHAHKALIGGDSVYTSRCASCKNQQWVKVPIQQQQ